MQETLHLNKMKHDVIPTALCQLHYKRLIAGGCNAQCEGCIRSHGITAVVVQQAHDCLYPTQLV